MHNNLPRDLKKDVDVQIHQMYDNHAGNFERTVQKLTLHIFSNSIYSFICFKPKINIDKSKYKLISIAQLHKKTPFLNVTRRDRIVHAFAIFLKIHRF